MFERAGKVMTRGVTSNLGYSPLDFRSRVLRQGGYLDYRDWTNSDHDTFEEA